MDNWSTQEDRKLARMWLVQGKTQKEIAFTLEKSPSATQRRIAAMDLVGEKGNIRLFATIFGEEVEPTIRPVTVDVAPVVRRDGATQVTAVHWSDVHYPFHDQRAINILYQITEDLQPDELYCQGDLLDFWQISKHRPPDITKMSPQEIDMQETINCGVQHLATMQSIANPSRAVFMDGNHEYRWNTLFANIQRDPTMLYLLNLQAVRDIMGTDKLMGLDKMGWDYYSYEGDSGIVVIRDKLVAIHGDMTSKWVTRSTLDKYGKSVIFGHTHRIQNWTQRDLKGQEAGWSMGCMCTINQHYTRFEDWHQGFSVVTWTQHNGQWFYDVEQIRIHEGFCIFRGKTYRG